MHVENMTASADELHFDDVSNDEALPAPNVRATGAVAQAVVSAFASAGLGDCDAARKVFVMCDNLSGRPNCYYRWTPLQKVGSSWLLNTCVGAPTINGGPIGVAPSLALWQSILAAAQAGGFRPTSGTLEQTNSVDARFFSWDGSNLEFSLGTSTLATP
jgi:hypothetical protein